MARSRSEGLSIEHRLLKIDETEFDRCDNDVQEERDDYLQPLIWEDAFERVLKRAKGP